MNIKLYFTSAFLLLTIIVAAKEIEITHGPYLQAISEESVTIVWTTNNDAVSWVDVAPDNTDSFFSQEHPKYYDTLHGRRVIGKLHRVKIDGLKPGSTYRYRIYSKEVLGYQSVYVKYGIVASSNVYERELKFTTLDSKAPEILFKVVNDIHNRTDMMGEMLKDVSRENTDLVFFNGDMNSWVDSQDRIFKGFMDTAISLFASEVPVFMVRGNHEIRGGFAPLFPDYFPTINGELYFNFTHGPVHFVVLDSGEDKPDSSIEYAELARFDEYRDKQVAWLKDIIKTDEFKNALYRVVVIHIPPVASSWHGTLDLQRKLVPVLNNANIDIMLAGHIHKYSYTEPNSQMKFPVLVNDDESYLDVKASQNEMVIFVKDQNNNFKHKHIIKK